MQLNQYIFSMIFFLCSAVAYCQDVNEIFARDGLPNFFAKLSTGKNVRIAYLGGSITEQPGYRVQTFEWFKKNWPNVKFTQVNAGIGGTGSGLGVFRLCNDVLSHNPDLVFVEFAVNDYSIAEKNSDKVIDSMEGIVRQIIRHDPNTDICFIYTIDDKMLDEYEGGKLPASIIAHEKIATHYSLPSINLGIEIFKLQNQRKLIMKGEAGEIKVVSGDSLNSEIDVPLDSNGQIVFSKDGVHPYPNAGHRIYTDTITKALISLKSNNKPFIHKLISPLSDNNLEYAKMIGLSEVSLKGDWQKYIWQSSLLPSGLKEKMPDILFAPKEGDSISFKFKGKVAGFYDVMGSSAGIVECEIDGKKSYVSRFDKYCTYYRINSKTFDIPQGTHSVKFTLTGKDIDKAAVLKEQGKTIKDMAPYNSKRWYVGNIMIVGEIMKDGNK
jgi:DNA-dependent RNA polymerase auxiliary subunit epsilon